VFAGDMRPLRFLGAADGSARVDLNHPLAPYTLQIEGHIVQTLGVSSERGGRSHDISDELTRNGPGMPPPHPAVPTDFSVDDAYVRLDEREDKLFYYQPRLVQHLDAQVRAQITELYAFLRPVQCWICVELYRIPEQLDLDVTPRLNAEELNRMRLGGQKARSQSQAELPRGRVRCRAVQCPIGI
jgi:hypothetical protein